MGDQSLRITYSNKFPFVAVYGGERGREEGGPFGPMGALKTGMWGKKNLE